MRSFGPDDLDPADAYTPAKPEREFEMVLGPRQLMIALGLLLTQMGLVAGIAYTAGRSAASLPPRAAVAATPAPAAVKPQTAPPSTAPTATPAPAPATTTTTTTPSAAVVAPAPAPAAVPTAEAGGTERPPAGLYLQVGSLDKAAAQQRAAALSRQGYQARLAPGTGAGVFRVLVGPTAPDQVKDMVVSLREAGFDSFPKRY